MKTLTLSDVLHCLISAELEHYEETKTDIFVNMLGQTNCTTIYQLQMLLKTFGEVIPEYCYQVVGEHSTRITTAYSCAAYAFFAMEVLDGLSFGGEKIKVEVSETEREKAILTDFCFHLRDYIGTNSFLFKGVR